VAAASSHTFAQVDAGAQSFMCGLKSSGDVYCWGNSLPSGGARDARKSSVPVLDATTTLKTITAANFWICGLDSAGKAYCWGDNSNGQLGDGSTTHRTSPSPVAGELSFTMISAGDVHVCGLVASGRAYCWGLNTNGAIGDGTKTHRLVPVPIGALP
jgi:alpha-tubulin suppressor-like RCC1 family protein